MSKRGGKFQPQFETNGKSINLEKMEGMLLFPVCLLIVPLSCPFYFSWNWMMFLVFIVSAGEKENKEARNPNDEDDGMVASSGIVPLLTKDKIEEAGMMAMTKEDLEMDDLLAAGHRRRVHS